MAWQPLRNAARRDGSLRKRRAIQPAWNSPSMRTAPASSGCSAGDLVGQARLADVEQLAGEDATFGPPGLGVGQKGGSRVMPANAFAPRPAFPCGVDTAPAKRRMRGRTWTAPWALRPAQPASWRSFALDRDAGLGELDHVVSGAGGVAQRRVPLARQTAALSARSR